MSDNTPTVTVGGPDGKMTTRPATPAEIAQMTKMRVALNDDGTQTLTNPKTGEQLTIDPAQLGEMETPAQKRLRKLRRSQRAKRIERVEIDGEDWFIRRLNFGELTRLGLLSSRDGSGLLDMSQAESITSLTAAMLFCCLAEDESGGDFFESSGDEPLSEPREWAEDVDPGVRKVVSELFNHILVLNPDILPGSGAAGQATPEEVKAREKKDESGAETSEPSSPPPTEPDANGGMNTGSTDEPVTSLGGTGAGEGSNDSGAAT